MDMYTALAKQCTSNRVYPLSIAQGIQDGEIIADDGRYPEAALFWHYAGFAYLSGNVKEAFLRTIYQHYFQKKPARRFVLITDNTSVIHFFSQMKDVALDQRAEYRYDTGRDPLLHPCVFPIERISASNIRGIHGRIIPAFSWSSERQFLSKGFGYAALDGNRVIAAAFSAAVSSEEVDIGVETDEAYRYRGLATVLASQMCHEIIAIGKQPVWAHGLSNTGSMHTALRVGFLQDRINVVIRRKTESRDPEKE